MEYPPYTTAKLRRLFNQRYGLDRGGNPGDRECLFREFVAGAEAVGMLADWSSFTDRIPHDGQPVTVKKPDGSTVRIKSWSNRAAHDWEGVWISSLSPLVAE